jgi:hypothetical protein
MLPYRLEYPVGFAEGYCAANCAMPFFDEARYSWFPGGGEVE